VQKPILHLLTEIESSQGGGNEFCLGKKTKTKTNNTMENNKKKSKGNEQGEIVIDFGVSFNIVIYLFLFIHSLPCVSMCNVH
jgi:hypothetical protein